MIDGKRVLGVVPARGGSKGIPRKNLRLVSGKSLLGWTIEVAQQSTLIDYLMVSTEDLEIAEEAKRYGCEVPFLRAAELATDTADAISVPLDAAMRCSGYDLLVLLAPTSPLRISEDIDGAIEKCVSSNAPACVSVCLVEENPYWMFTLGEGDRMIAVAPEIPPRRQELPQAYILNGAVYVARTEWLKREGQFLTPETVAFEMPRSRSLDIDTEADLNRFSRMAGSKLS